MTARPGPRLTISARDMASLRAAAAEAYPNEFCALLIGMVEGQRARVTRIVLAANRDPNPRRGFELDPAVLIATLRELREAERAGRSKERLIGHAHSHPDAPAIPSATDRAMAHEPGLIWLIFPVEQGRAGPPNAFKAARGAAGKTTFRKVLLGVPRTV